MNNHYRHIRRLFLAGLFAFPMIFQGCILVVEEDNFGRRHAFHGSEWYLEIVFYRAETFSSDDRQIEIIFGADDVVSGITACGSFQGVFELDDADNLSVNGLAQECPADGTSALFLGQLANARKLYLQDDVLRIETEGSDYLKFNRK